MEPVLAVLVDEDHTFCTDCYWEQAEPPYTCEETRTASELEPEDQCSHCHRNFLDLVQGE